MHYISLIYEYHENAERLPDSDYQALIEQHRALQDPAQHAGFRGCGRLVASRQAVSVRHDNAQSLITDGPFAECKEILVGFYHVESDDLDGALAYARHIPTASMAGVELRPVDAGHCPPSSGSPKLLTEASTHPVYALLNYLDAEVYDALSEDERQQLVDENTRMAMRADEAGHYVFGHKLMSTLTSTSLRHGKIPYAMMDGPFAEAKEVLLGFHALRCADIETAARYAAALPEARIGVVEVREIDYLVY